MPSYLTVVFVETVFLQHSSHSRQSDQIMAKRFTPDNDKWGIKISFDKKRARSTSRSSTREVVIRNLNSINSNGTAQQVKLITKF